MTTNWLLPSLGLGALAAMALPVLRFLYRLYRFNLLPRYSDSRAMRLHPFEVDFHGTPLQHYYGDFRKCISGYSPDASGIVAFRPPLQAAGQAGMAHNPCMVAEYAIVQFEQYLQTRSAENKASFQKHADWLMAHATPVGEGTPGKVCFFYEYDTLEEKAPWGSAIGQGMAISALLRAAQLFERSDYQEVAEQAFRLLDTPVAQGGFRFQDAEFALWYEEDNHATHILNGHIYALLGVYDLYRVTRNPYYLECFRKGARTIEDTIGRFDMGFFSQYCAQGNRPANNSYHLIHVTLFQILGRLSEGAFFPHWAKRFAAYHRGSGYRARLFWHLLSLTIHEKRRGLGGSNSEDPKVKSQWSRA